MRPIVSNWLFELPPTGFSPIQPARCGDTSPGKLPLGWRAEQHFLTQLRKLGNPPLTRKPTSWHATLAPVRGPRARCNPFPPPCRRLALRPPPAVASPAQIAPWPGGAQRRRKVGGPSLGLTLASTQSFATRQGFTESRSGGGKHSCDPFTKPLVFKMNVPHRCTILNLKEHLSCHTSYCGCTKSYTSWDGMKPYKYWHKPLTNTLQILA